MVGVIDGRVEGIPMAAERLTIVATHLQEGRLITVGGEAWRPLESSDISGVCRA